MSRIITIASNNLQHDLLVACIIVGTLYPTNYLQLFRVTCPADTLLYMTILRMDLSCGTGYVDACIIVIH